MPNKLSAIIRLNFPGKRYIFLLFFNLSFCSSCRKFIDIQPPQTQLTNVNVFSSDATAISALTGIYGRMMQSGSGFISGNQSLSVFLGLYSDEFINYSVNANQIEFFTNSLIRSNGAVSSVWSELYQYIYTANAILDNLNDSSSPVSKKTRIQLTGEARFIRAFCYFYLVNLYGNVPLILTSNYLSNENSTRDPVNAVYTQIIADLIAAQNFLPGDFSASNGERVRPNAGTATALLARVYLYQGEWASAEAESSLLINNNQLYSLTNLNDVFLANSTEAIWQLQPVVPGYNTFDGYVFILSGAPDSYNSTVSISSYLQNAFENGDSRKLQWVDSSVTSTATYYYPHKYKIKLSPSVSEYEMIFRLAEQFLIRAEARAMQNNITGSLADLNTIRSRADLQNTVATTVPGLLTSIYHETQVELFSEHGQRWLNLKRTGNAGTVLSPIKSNWAITDTLLPIPQSDIQKDPNLIQNAGY